MAMTTHERRMALFNQRKQVVEIAKRLGVKRQAVSAVLNGREYTPYIQRAIADELGLSVEVVFGRRTEVPA